MRNEQPTLRNASVTSRPLGHEDQARGRNPAHDALSRRRFLTGSTATLGALIVGCRDDVLIAPRPGTTARAGRPRLDVASPAAVAELPRAYIDTTYQRPTAGQLRSVPDTGDAVQNGVRLQGVINSAQPGDVIELTASAVYQAPADGFALPEKAGAGWIYIQTAAYGQLPAPGTRVRAADRLAMPILLGTTQYRAVLHFPPRSHHWRFVGIGVTVDPSVGGVYQIVEIDGHDYGSGAYVQSASDLPHDIVFDRCDISGHDRLDVRRGILMNGNALAVVDSRVYEAHSGESDAQALAAWCSAGPLKIVNNYLMGSTEVVAFGGADPTVAGIRPADVEIRRNHLFKPRSWVRKTDGGAWILKNMIESKCSQRVLFEANYVENCVLGDGGQNGFAVVLKTTNQEGANLAAETTDWTIRYNRFDHCEGAYALTGYQQNTASAGTRRITIHDNLWTDFAFAPAPTQFLKIAGSPSNNPALQLRDVDIRHETAVAQAPAGVMIFIGADGSDDGSGIQDTTVNFALLNCILTRNEYGLVGQGMVGSGEGTPSLQRYAPGTAVAGNLFIGAPASQYPSNNGFPADVASVGFVSPSGQDWRLAAASPYKGAGTDGRDPGADVDAVGQYTLGVRDPDAGVAPPPPQQQVSGTFAENFAAATADTNLDAYAPNGTTRFQYALGSGGAMRVSATRHRAEVTTPNWIVLARAVANGLPTANQRIRATVHAERDASYAMSAGGLLALRCAADSASGYIVLLNPAVANEILLAKIVNGTIYNMGSADAGLDIGDYDLEFEAFNDEYKYVALVVRVRDAGTGTYNEVIRFTDTLADRHVSGVPGIGGFSTTAGYTGAVTNISIDASIT